MTRALLAQELGMGLWHARLLGAVGGALREAGLDVTYAMADPVRPRAMLGSDAPVLPAPCYVPPDRLLGTVDARGLADVLEAAGWGDPAVLDALMASWEALLALVRPDVVVVDHAPTLLALLRGVVPVVHVGLGFTTPPPTLPRLPDLRADSRAGEAAGPQEERLLGALEEAMVRRGRPVALTLPAALEADATFVTVLPDLDPYRRWRREAPLGPVEQPAPLAPAHAERPWFAYLAADDPRTEPLLGWLASIEPAGRAYVRGADAAMAARLRDRGVALQDGPVDLDLALAGAAVAVHHGGAGTIWKAVTAGRPQLLLPRHLEQHWNAAVVTQRGASGIPDSMDVGDLAAAWREASSPRARANARSWAPVAAAQAEPDAAERIAEACVSLAGVTR